MANLNFRILMRCNRVIGDYHHPWQRRVEDSLFQVVSRSGKCGEHLCVSNLEPTNECKISASSLQKSSTLVGLLTNDDASTGMRTFVFSRISPDGTDYPGEFYPAEGVAHLFLKEQTAELKAWGKTAYRVERRAGVSIIVDDPNPMHNTNNSHFWSFASRQIPWDHELWLT